MTILEAIQQADALNPNTYDQKQKIVWLSRCEASVERFVEQHEGAEDIPFIGFDENTSVDTKLLIPQPNDEAYVHWLCANISLANREVEDYNNFIAMFNTAMTDFRNWWLHNHLPKNAGRFLF